MGMRQRLAIGQAIMENPEILILDEPMNGLDNHGVEDMRKIFLELKNMGKTILLASHNREDIDVLCDKVYEMDRGELNKYVSLRKVKSMILLLIWLTAAILEKMVKDISELI